MKGCRLSRLTPALALAALMTVSGCWVLAPNGEDPVRGEDSRRWFKSPALQSLLDRATSSRSEPGHELRLLMNGKEAFARRYENLESATFVLVKTFIFASDEEGQRMADALSAKARTGVPVLLQYDLKGSIGGKQDLADMLERVSPERPVGEKPVIAGLRQAGVHAVATNSPARPLELKEWFQNAARLFKAPGQAAKRATESMVLFDHCDHEKLFITGHEGGEVRAILGGMNIASEYALGGIPGRRDAGSDRAGWRDTDIEVQGPAAYHALDDFLTDLERHEGRALPEALRAPMRAVDRRHHPGGAFVRFVASHPTRESDRRTEELYRVLLKATPPGEPVFIASPYFAPSRRLREAIVDHGSLGGTVTVLTNSAAATDVKILSDAARYAALEIMKRTDGFRLVEWQPRTEQGEHTLHQKVASFGLHGPVIVGSFNLDAQSTIHNTEAVVLVDYPAFRERFDRMVERDLQPDRAHEVSRDQIESQPILDRLRAFLSHELAWYWL